MLLQFQVMKYVATALIQVDQMYPPWKKCLNTSVVNSGMNLPSKYFMDLSRSKLRKSVAKTKHDQTCDNLERIRKKDTEVPPYLPSANSSNFTSEVLLDHESTLQELSQKFTLIIMLGDPPQYQVQN